MAEIITVADLPASIQDADLVETMVAGANAQASRVAPCLASTDPAPTAEQIAEAKLALIGAVQRWVRAGAGALQQESVGPFGATMDTRQRSGFNLWPSEITHLQEICKSVGENAGAFSVDTAPAGTIHADWCSINFGANYCSCGAVLAGYPIFEQA